MIVASVVPLVIGVFVIIIGGIVAYYLVRASKGKLELHLPRTGFGSGEQVAGTVTITTKKALDVRRFFVALIGREEIERRDDSGDGKRTESREVYRDEYSFLDGEQLAAGINRSFEFQLVAPGKESVDGGGVRGGGIEFNIGDISLGGDRRRMRWSVEARVDLPGVDLAKSKSVRVNLS